MQQILEEFLDTNILPNPNQTITLSVNEQDTKGSPNPGQTTRPSVNKQVMEVPVV